MLHSVCGTVPVCVLHSWPNTKFYSSVNFFFFFLFYCASIVGTFPFTSSQTRTVGGSNWITRFCISLGMRLFNFLCICNIRQRRCRDNSCVMNFQSENLLTPRTEFYCDIIIYSLNRCTLLVMYLPIIKNSITSVRVPCIIIKIKYDLFANIDNWNIHLSFLVPIYLHDGHSLRILRGICRSNNRRQTP